MTPRSRAIAGLLTGTLLCLLVGLPGAAQTQVSPPQRAVEKEGIVTARATGTFDVKLVPQPPADSAEATSISRLTIDKQFHGDLAGTSKGEMLAAGTSVKGSAGYVAIEQVRGTLHGRSGSFVLQHSATMTRGAPHLSITVVPDSGTGELAGLTGRMMITIADGKHSYEFEYTLPDQ
jgi:predicted flavoprotein YhiN